MRPTGLIGIIVVAITLATCAKAEAQVSLQPGLYERAFETEAAGATGKHKDTLCMTPADAKDVVKTIATAGAETNCKVSDVKTSAGGKLTFKMSGMEAAARLPGLRGGRACHGPPQAELPGDFAQQPFAVERLRQEGVGLEAGTDAHGVGFGGRRDGDDAHAAQRRDFADRCHGLRAAHHRHLEVHDDQVRGE